MSHVQKFYRDVSFQLDDFVQLSAWHNRCNYQNKRRLKPALIERETHMSKTYNVVTQKIIKQLEAGTIPWRQPWSNKAGISDQQNIITGNQYRGINALMTGCQSYLLPYWLTFKQANDLGCHVKKGEVGTPIVYWLKRNEAKKEDSDPDEKSRGYMVPLYSTVFNIEQVTGEKLDKIVEKYKNKARNELIKFNPIQAAEEIVAAYANKPAIVNKQQRACYSPSADLINMPIPESFTSVEAYYATLFHELGHSTGHESRLNRKLSTSFGNHEYSKEELVAEFTSAFLCSVAGIDSVQVEQSAAYIQSWLKVLKGDPKLLMQAASAAQKAADMIRGIEYKPKSVAEDTQPAVA